MASRVGLSTVAAVVLVLCAGGCSSDNGETKVSPSASPDPASQTSPQATPSEPEKEITVDLGDGVTMKMVLIPAGEFMMGSHESAEEVAKAFDFDASSLKWLKTEHPQHRVKISKPYYLGVHEVTQSQYEKVMGDKPWSGKLYAKEGPE